MLIAAIDELPAGDVVCYLLCLSKLSGQRPLSCCHDLEGENFLVPSLVRVVLGQVLGLLEVLVSLENMTTRQDD